MSNEIFLLKKEQKIEDENNQNLTILSKEHYFLNKICDLNSEENKYQNNSYEKIDLHDYFNYNIKKQDKLNEKEREEKSIIENENILVNLPKNNNNINYKNDIKSSGKKIFEINKIIKLGRAKKLSQRERKHNKFAKDNVIRRIKVQLIKNIYEYINSLFNINNYGKSKKPINIIKKVNSLLIKSISKEDNLRWLDSTVEFFFSHNISVKLTNFEKDYNQKLIKRIIEKNEEKKVITILKKTIKEMLYAYVTNDEEQKFPGFKTIQNDIKNFKEKGEDNSYIELYILIAKNFQNLFEIIKARRKRKLID